MASNKGEKQKTESVGTEEQRGEFDLLTRILDEGRLARDEVQTERAKDIIAGFVQEIMQGQMVRPGFPSADVRVIWRLKGRRRCRVCAA